MLTDTEKLELFDGLLRDALTLSYWYMAQSHEFSGERTAAKNIDAIRALRDSKRDTKANQPAATETGPTLAEAVREFLDQVSDSGSIPSSVFNTRELEEALEREEAETAPQGAPAHRST